jgi:hypothetical protein
MEQRMQLNIIMFLTACFSILVSSCAIEEEGNAKVDRAFHSYRNISDCIIHEGINYKDKSAFSKTYDLCVAAFKSTISGEFRFSKVGISGQGTTVASSEECIATYLPKFSLVGSMKTKQQLMAKICDYAFGGDPKDKPGKISDL